VSTIEETGLGALARGHSLGGIYLSNDEHVRLVAHGSAASVRLAIEGRLIATDGSVNTIRAELAPTSDRLASTVIANAREGWLLHGHVRVVSGAPNIGQCFCRVEIVRGRTGDVTPLMTLAQGYVGALSNLTWPEQFTVAPGDGRGFIRNVTGTDPAAGADWSETVPTNARWRLIAARAALVTDATVASRTASITVDDGTTTVWNMPCHTTQAASLTFTYYFTAIGASGFASGNTLVIPAPPDMVMGPGWRVRAQTGTIQAGDNWGAPQLWVEEWIEG
jgi:hypothetical protein